MKWQVNGFHPVVYKIGSNLYESGHLKTDVNGGWHEYKLIKEAIDRNNGELYENLKKANAIILIGGKLEEEEKKMLLDNIEDYSKCIFVVTDFVAFETCKDLIKKCHWVLHQSPKNINLIPYHVKQRYSYVPELFYDPLERKPDLQHDLCLFGGGSNGREDLINKYIFENDYEWSHIRNGIVALLKTNKFDNRISYKEFMKLMSQFKFSICISRYEYRKYGFITPRFIEAIANFNLPICDVSYDMYNHFGNYTKTWSWSVSNYNELINMMVMSHKQRQDFIDMFREQFNKSRWSFVEVIKECLL